MRDKRDLILECLRDRSTSADAILNHLHQNGWMVVPKAAPPVTTTATCDHCGADVAL